MDFISGIKVVNESPLLDLVMQYCRKIDDRITWEQANRIAEKVDYLLPAQAKNLDDALFQIEVKRYFDEIVPVSVKMKPLTDKFIFKPHYSTEDSAGADLYAVEDITIGPGEIKVLKTNIAMEIPVGYEIQIRSRSGLAAKHGIMVLNSPGTIDADFRGEILVILHNTNDIPYYVKKDDRIAQAILAKSIQANFVWDTNLGETARGDGGLGSTGK